MPVSDKARLKTAKAIADATKRLGDEAGRTPCQEWVFFNQNVAICDPVCRVTFLTVPRASVWS